MRASRPHGLAARPRQGNLELLYAVENLPLIEDIYYPNKYLLPTNFYVCVGASLLGCARRDDADAGGDLIQLPSPSLNARASLSHSSLPAGTARPRSTPKTSSLTRAGGTPLTAARTRSARPSL